MKHLLKGKGKLACLLTLLIVSFCLLSCFFYFKTTMAYEQALDGTQAEIMASRNNYTIKEENGKYYYYDSNGNKVTTKGWKKNGSGQYTYYVGNDGYITARIKNGKYEEWKNGWSKKTLKKSSIKKLHNKYFYVNKNGNVSKTTGWKRIGENDVCYVDKDGTVSYEIDKTTVYQYSGKTKTKYNNKSSVEKIKNRYLFFSSTGVDQTKGWKFSNGEAYYVGDSGQVTAKIVKDKSGALKYFYKSGTEFKIKESKKSATIKKRKNLYFYYNKDKAINLNSGWHKRSNGTYGFYIASGGFSTDVITDKDNDIGIYKHFDNGKFTVVKDYKNTVHKVCGKNFYFNSNGRVDQTDGWKKDANGKAVYYVKDGLAQVNITVEVNGFQTVFNEDGKKVTLKKSGNKIVRSDTGEAVTKKGTYKIGTGDNKTIYHCDNTNGEYKTSGTVKVGDQVYTISSDGTCNTVREHVHQWSPLDENGKAFKNSEVINHKAKTEKKDVKVADEWTEWRQSDKKKQICLICVWAKAPKDGEQWEDENGDGKWSAQVEGRYYFKDYCFDTLDELQKHEKDVHNNASKPTYNYIYTPIHHEAQYEKKDVITEEAWDEWYEYRRCTECGEKMTEHVIKGKDSKGNDTILHIPDNSGEICTRLGSKYLMVTKNKPYLCDFSDPEVLLSKEKMMEKYGFAYIGKKENYNGALSKDWLLLLKDHNIDY